MNRLKNGLGVICALGVLIPVAQVIPIYEPKPENEPSKRPARSHQALRSDYLGWRRSIAPSPWETQRRIDIERVRRVGKSVRRAPISPKRSRPAFERRPKRDRGRVVAHGGDSGVL